MDLTRLQPVFEEAGPYWSLHVEVGRAGEDGEQQVESRWDTIRHRLEHADARPELIEDLGARVTENHHLPGEVRRTLVATDAGQVLLDDLQVGHSPRPETVDHDLLPELSGWLTGADLELPFVLVRTDRTGADFEVHRALRGPSLDTESVTGETFYITKVAPGDWAQKQFQQSAENAWHHNAELVADTVRSLQARHRVAAVLVAGEVRARSEVLRALGEDRAPGSPRVVELESGGRAAGSSEQSLWDDVHEQLQRLQAADETELVERLQEGRGRGTGVATGLDAVLATLAEQRVERLVVDLDALADEAVRPSKHPGLALPPGTPDDDLPAARVLVAAGSLSGARLSLVGERLAGAPVSALLRWDDRP